MVEIAHFIVGHFAGVEAGSSELSGADDGVGCGAAALPVAAGEVDGVYELMLTFLVDEGHEALFDRVFVNERIGNFGYDIDERVAHPIDVIFFRHVEIFFGVGVLTRFDEIAYIRVRNINSRLKRMAPFS